MKRVHLVVRIASYLLIGLVIALIALYAYLAIPRSIGEIRVDTIELVSGHEMVRLGEFYVHDEDRPAQMLRIAISSESELITRAEAVAGSVDSLYAWSGPCPFQEPYGKSGTTRGPFPDDLPTRIDGEYGLRYAHKQKDGRFRYTAYVNADALDGVKHGLCLKITSTWFFSPHTESRVIEIPPATVQKALSRPESHEHQVLFR